MNLYVILVIVGVIIIGFVNQIFKIKQLSEKMEYLDEYSSKFNEFIKEAFEGKRFNDKEYAWLVSKTDKMQIMLGTIGIVDYQYLGVYYKNIAILLNLIGSLPEMKNSIFVDMQLLVFEAQGCQNAFIRLASLFDETFDIERKKLFNPFYCLTNGMKLIISLPIYLLNNIGLISNDNARKIESSFFIKLTGGLLSLITILSGIVTIVVGWETFIEIIKKLF